MLLVDLGSDHVIVALRAIDPNPKKCRCDRLGDRLGIVVALIEKPNRSRLLRTLWPCQKDLSGNLIPRSVASKYILQIRSPVTLSLTDPAASCSAHQQRIERVGKILYVVLACKQPVDPLEPFAPRLIQKKRLSLAKRWNPTGDIQIQTTDKLLVGAILSRNDRCFAIAQCDPLVDLRGNTLRGNFLRRNAAMPRSYRYEQTDYHRSYRLDGKQPKHDPYQANGIIHSSKVKEPLPKPHPCTGRQVYSMQ